MSLHEDVIARCVPGVRLAGRPILKRSPVTDGNVKSDCSDVSEEDKQAATQEETATLHDSDFDDNELAECNVIIQDERPCTSPFPVTAQVTTRKMNAYSKAYRVGFRNTKAHVP